MLVRYCEKCGKFVMQGKDCSCRNGNKNREKEDEFYSEYEWKKVAMAARMRANYTDEYLLQFEGKMCEGHLVHHIIPKRERPDLALSLDNLVVVSPRTHDMIHKAYATSADEKAKMIRQLKLIRGQGGECVSTIGGHQKSF